jgi:hypothetical protein
MSSSRIQFMGDDRAQQKKKSEKIWVKTIAI